MAVPIGRGRLNMAAWMVPNGEAITCAMRARGNRRLARQQRAEILEADRVGQQREDQRADADRRKSPPSTPHAVDAYATLPFTPLTQHRNATVLPHACRRIGGNATRFFYGLINLANVLTAARRALPRRHGRESLRKRSRNLPRDQAANRVGNNS